MQQLLFVPRNSVGIDPSIDFRRPISDTISGKLSYFSSFNFKCGILFMRIIGKTLPLSNSKNPQETVSSTFIWIHVSVTIFRKPSYFTDSFRNSLVYCKFIHPLVIGLYLFLTVSGFLAGLL